MTILNQAGINARAHQNKVRENTEYKLRKARLLACINGFESYRQRAIDIVDTLEECKRQGVGVSKSVSGNPLEMGVNYAGEYYMYIESWHLEGYSCQTIRYFFGSGGIQTSSGWCSNYHVTVKKDDFSEMELELLLRNDDSYHFDVASDTHISLMDALEKMLSYMEGYVNTMTERLTNL